MTQIVDIEKLKRAKAAFDAERAQNADMPDFTAVVSELGERLTQLPATTQPEAGLQAFFFENDANRPVRIVVLDGKPWFVGMDVAKILGYADTDDAVRCHCKHGRPAGADVSRQNAGIHHRTILIPEGDVYRLGARSNLPSADLFERWLFDEVVPSIMKTGAYAFPGAKPGGNVVDLDDRDAVKVKLLEQAALVHDLKAQNAELTGAVTKAVSVIYDQQAAAAQYQSEREARWRQDRRAAEAVRLSYARHITLRGVCDALNAVSREIGCGSTVTISGLKQTLIAIGWAKQRTDATKIVYGRPFTYIVPSGEARAKSYLVSGAPPRVVGRGEVQGSWNKRRWPVEPDYPLPFETVFTGAGSDELCSRWRAYQLGGLEWGFLTGAQGK